MQYNFNQKTGAYSGRLFQGLREEIAQKEKWDRCGGENKKVAREKGLWPPPNSKDNYMGKKKVKEKGGKLLRYRGVRSPRSMSIDVLKANVKGSSLA